jgi:hypothetical protein
MIKPRTYEIPAVPMSLNEYTRAHWAVQKKAREAFQELLWALFNEKGNAIPRGLEAVDVRAAIAFTTDRRRDSDNYGAVLAKWTQDVLVSLGVIPDDTADRCTVYPPAITLGDTPTTFLVISERVQGATTSRRASLSLKDESGDPDRGIMPPVSYRGSRRRRR